MNLKPDLFNKARQKRNDNLGDLLLVSSHISAVLDVLSDFQIFGLMLASDGGKVYQSGPRHHTASSVPDVTVMVFS